MTDLHLLLFLPLLQPSAMSGAVGTSRGKSRTGAMSAESAPIHRQPPPPRYVPLTAAFRSLGEALGVVCRGSFKESFSTTTFFSPATTFFTGCPLADVTRCTKPEPTDSETALSQSYELFKHTDSLRNKQTCVISTILMQ